MSENPTTPGKLFYDQQVASLEASDVDGLMAQYHPDAVLIGFEAVVRGQQALRDHFVRYLDRLGALQIGVHRPLCRDRRLDFLRSDGRDEPGQARVYDVFLLRDGKVTHQFTGVISFSPRSFPT